MNETHGRGAQLCAPTNCLHSTQLQTAIKAAWYEYLCSGSDILLADAVGNIAFVLVIIQGFIPEETNKLADKAILVAIAK